MYPINKFHETIPLEPTKATAKKPVFQFNYAFPNVNHVL